MKVMITKGSCAMAKIKEWQQWAEDVRSGKVLMSKLTILAVERYFSDLNTGLDRGLTFDNRKAERAINFFKFLKHFKGEFAGKQFVLEPWQQFIVAQLYGWTRSDGTRRFRSGYIEMAKKNGKTTFMSGLGLFALDADGEAAAEVYSAATTKEQSKICFESARQMVMKSPLLSKRITAYQHNLHVLATASKFEPVSSEAKNLEGKNTSCGIIDEYHIHKTNEVVNNIASGMVARKQPLLLYITTAGTSKQSPCYKYRDTIVKILKGILVDDATFCIIFTLDEKDDWNDKSKWCKANPCLGASLQMSALEDEYTKAKNTPSEFEVSFKTKNLNLWVDSYQTWIEDEVWNLGDVPINAEELHGLECYGGLDLSSVEDITSLVLSFPRDDGYIDVMPFFWVPEDTVPKRLTRDGINYPDWVRNGFVKVTPGNTTDYDCVTNDIVTLQKIFNIKRIEYDRWNSSQTIINLTGEGLNMVPFGQGYSSMSAPTKQLLTYAVKGKLRHGGHPVLRWMCSNIVIEKDAAENIKMSKSKSKEKIDGMVSLVMSIGGYMTEQSDGGSGSVYDTDEIKSL